MNRPTGESLTPRVKSYVAGTVFLAAVCGLFVAANASHPPPLLLLFWTSAFLAGELMVFKTPTGKGKVSMAATMHLAAFPIVGPAALVYTIWVSRLTANLVVQQQPWYKALFNAAQVSLCVLGAYAAYRLLGGTQGLLLDRELLLRLAGPWAAAAVVYYVLNTMLVCGVLSLTSSTPFLVTWRENWGYRVEMVSAAALFLLAPVASHAYQGMGAVGMAVFLLPMWCIRDACERYIALERAQRALLGSERLAAKGEMAASVGHELNNYMSVLHGNLQLLDLGDDLPVRIKDRLDTIGAQVKNMTALSRGLMDFSHLESRKRPLDIGELVRDTVAFLKPQNRFDQIRVDVEHDERLGDVVADPAQLQQILMNLLNNAADAMQEAGTPSKRIRVITRLRASEERMEMVVDDSGPGVPPERRDRIFEPSFTTKETGHGFGLSTVFRIVRNHKGSIKVEQAPGGGALFRILIPYNGSAAPSSRAAA